MVQLEDGVHLGLGVADTWLEEIGQPLQDYQSLLVADRNFEQALSVDKVVEHFPLRTARLGRDGQPGDTVAAENGAADLSEHLIIQPIPAEVAVGAQSHEVELL